MNILKGLVRLAVITLWFNELLLIGLSNIGILKYQVNWIEFCLVGLITLLALGIKDEK
jgi:hypothetical protein